MVYKQTTRQELRLELKRIAAFRKRVKKGEQDAPDLVDYLSRALGGAMQVDSINARVESAYVTALGTKI